MTRLAKQVTPLRRVHSPLERGTPGIGRRRCRCGYREPGRVIASAWVARRWPGSASATIARGRVGHCTVTPFFCRWPQLEGRLPVRFWLSIRCIEPMRFRILLQVIHILADAGMIGQLSDFVRASALEFPEAGIGILSLQRLKTGRQVR